MKQTFSLTAIAGVTTGRLLKDGGFGEIQDVIMFMNRWDDIYTVQTIEGANRCRGELIRQLPWLAELGKEKGYELSKMTPENYMEYVAHWIVKYGEWHEIEPMPLDDAKPATSELELILRLKPDANVISVNTQGETVPTVYKPKPYLPSAN